MLLVCCRVVIARNRGLVATFAHSFLAIGRNHLIIIYNSIAGLDVPALFLLSLFCQNATMAYTTPILIIVSSAINSVKAQITASIVSSVASPAEAACLLLALISAFKLKQVTGGVFGVPTAK